MDAVKTQNFDQKIIINNLHEKFSFYGKNAKEFLRKCMLMLPEIEKNRVWEKKGFENIYEYARILAGMSRYTVNEALRTLQKTFDKPELMHVIEKKGINAVKPVLAIATKETAGFWAEKAENMSMHTLETYVKEYKNGLRAQSKTTNFPYQEAVLISGQNGMPARMPVGDADEVHVPAADVIGPTLHISTLPVSKNSASQISMELDEEVKNELTKLKGEKSWNTLMKELLEIRKKDLERLKKEAEERYKQEEAKNRAEQKQSNRAVPAAIGKYVRAKNNGTCAYRDCTKTGEILHHADRFSLYSDHDPEKIHLLCKNHEHLAHFGYFENEQDDPAVWRIKTEAYREESERYGPEFEADKLVMKYYNGSRYKFLK